MSRAHISSTNATWQWKLRCWLGVVLMAVSLFGGFRTATRVMEETSGESSEVQEYAHRQVEANGPRRHLGGGADHRNALRPLAQRAPVSRPVERLCGESESPGHQIANGLRAPLRC